MTALNGENAVEGDSTILRSLNRSKLGEDSQLGETKAVSRR